MFSNLFSKIRDKAYNFVDKEVGTALHFFSDFIRGHTKNEYNKINVNQKKEKRLTAEETKIFKTLLKRKKGEKQLDYWRRKRLINNLDNKKILVQEVIGIQKRQSYLNKQSDTISIKKEKQSLEMKMTRIKMAESNTLNKYSNRDKT